MKQNKFPGVSLLGIIIAGLLIFIEKQTHTSFGAILYGLAGMSAGLAAVSLFRFFYWQLPGKREHLAEHLEELKIDETDELKIQLRDKAGLYSYYIIINLTFLAVLILLILSGVREQLPILWVGLGLAVFFVVQIVINQLVYRRLLKHYE